MRRIKVADPTMASLQDAVEDEFKRMELAIQINTKRVIPRRFADCFAQWGDFLIVDPTSGAFSVFLPRATFPDIGKTITIKNNSSSTNIISVMAFSGNLIDGASSVTMNTAWRCLQLGCLDKNTVGVL